MVDENGGNADDGNDLETGSKTADDPTEQLIHQYTHRLGEIQLERKPLQERMNSLNVEARTLYARIRVLKEFLEKRAYLTLRFVDAPELSRDQDYQALHTIIQNYGRQAGEQYEFSKHRLPYIYGTFGYKGKTYRWEFNLVSKTIMVIVLSETLE